MHTNTRLDTTIDDQCVNLSILLCEGLGCRLSLPCASLTTNHTLWSCLQCIDQSSNQREEQTEKVFSWAAMYVADDHTHTPSLEITRRFSGWCGINEHFVATHEPTLQVRFPTTKLFHITLLYDPSRHTHVTIFS